MKRKQLRRPRTANSTNLHFDRLRVNEVNIRASSYERLRPRVSDCGQFGRLQEIETQLDIQADNNL